RPVEQAGPQRVEEAAVHAAVGQQAHVPRVGIREDGLRAVRVDHAPEAAGEPVVGVAADGHGLARLVNVHGHDAGVGTVVRADDLQRAPALNGGAHASIPSRMGRGRPWSSTATSTTSASVTFTLSPLSQRSASTLTLTVMEVRPMRTVSV